MRLPVLAAANILSAHCGADAPCRPTLQLGRGALAVRYAVFVRVQQVHLVIDQLHCLGWVQGVRYKRPRGNNVSNDSLGFEQL